MKRILMIGGFAALVGLAVAGWIRKPQPLTEQTMVTAPAPVAPAAQAPAARVQPAVQREYVPARKVVKRPRPTGHSVAIVAGSAGTGAAIGAIAGGGKGAAIGALSGGAAGFIYDRLTRQK